MQTLLRVSADQYDRAAVEVYPGRYKVLPFDRGAVYERSGDLVYGKRLVRNGQRRRSTVRAGHWGD